MLEAVYKNMGDGVVMPHSNLREIEFRALKQDDKNMIYGQLLQWNKEAWIYTERDKCFAVDYTTKGQFTGLHDKNGGKIYERDVVLMKHEGKYEPFIIVFRAPCFVAKHFNSEDTRYIVENEVECIDVYYDTELEHILDNIKRRLSELMEKVDEHIEQNNN